MVLGNSMQRQFDPTHEVRGGVNAAAEALGAGALGPVRVLVTFPEGNAASAPVKEPTLDAVRQKMAQAPNIVSVSPPAFGDDYRSALLGRAVGGPRTWPPATPSTGCANSCRGRRGWTRGSTSAGPPR